MLPRNVSTFLKQYYVLLIFVSVLLFFESLYLSNIIGNEDARLILFSDGPKTMLSIAFLLMPVVWYGVCIFALFKEYKKSDPWVLVHSQRQEPMEDMAKRYEALMAEAFGKAQDGIAILDKSNRILYANECFIKMHQRTDGKENSILGSDWSNFFDRGGQDYMTSQIRPSVTIRGGWNGCLTLPQNDNKMLYGDTVVTRFSADMSLVIMRDVTEQKSLDHERDLLKERLFYAQKIEAVSRLIEGMGGDFTDALSIIRDRAEHAIQSDDIPQERRKYMADILTASDKAQSMVDNIMSFSKGKNSKAEFLNVTDTLISIVNKSMRKYKSTIQFDMNMELDSAYVFVDRLDFERVIAGVIENAAEAVQGKPVRISLSSFLSHDRPLDIETKMAKPEHYLSDHRPVPQVVWGDAANFIVSGEIDDRVSYIRISIQDNAGGIAPEVLPNIFDPFFTTKGHRDNAGVGLSAVYGFVTSNKGGIAVESMKGRGTSVHLYIPRAENVKSSDITYSPQMAS